MKDRVVTWRGCLVDFVVYLFLFALFGVVIWRLIESSVVHY